MSKGSSTDSQSAFTFSLIGHSHGELSRFTAANSNEMISDETTLGEVKFVTRTLQ